LTIGLASLACGTFFRGTTVCAPLYYPEPGAFIDAVADHLQGKLYA